MSLPEGPIVAAAGVLPDSWALSLWLAVSLSHTGLAMRRGLQLHPEQLTAVRWPREALGELWGDLSLDLCLAVSGPPPLPLRGVLSVTKGKPE